MDSTTFIYLYLLGLPVFIVLDVLWVGVLMRGFYQQKLSHLFGPLKWVSGALFYAVFVFGLTYFVTYPMTAIGFLSYTQVAFMGALFGFVAYATYDLVNHATLRDWPVAVTVVDIAWGTVLSMTSAVGAVALFQFILMP